jgi:hypothetical protein
VALRRPTPRSDPETHMSALEKKLCNAIEDLIAHAIEYNPKLKKPLRRIQGILRELAG